MRNESVSLREAKNLILNSQRLVGSALSPIEIIEHLGYVQIDAISVVERAHHHVFWSRNDKYRPADLDELVKSREVFEYWSHAASYLPMSEYRFSLPLKKAFQKKSWFPRDTKLMGMLVKRIRSEGPLQSKDFVSAKPTKMALEQLFLEGRIEVTRRDSFQKVYDIPERVIPNSVNTTMPSDEEYVHYLIDRTLRHHGLASVDEIAYLQKKDIKSKIAKEISHMLEDESVAEVKVEGIDDRYFVLPNSLSTISKFSSKVLVLSPFDNMIIQRKKLKMFFNFDYNIECYVPAQKRKFGYFSLPIFVGDQAVARVDCKAYRKEQVLAINSIYYEQKMKDRIVDLETKITKKLKSFAKFNGCNLSL